MYLHNTKRPFLDVDPSPNKLFFIGLTCSVPAGALPCLALSGILS